ncbi:MAG: hypothetical protein HRT35_13210 [Algicola sp.]|nr:hypothetical protein [Algicola sp.]
MKNKQTLLASMLLAFSFGQTANADEVILDDLIVTGSACIGVECVANLDFGFDTLQLVSPNPQISFIDTSSSSSFPTTDWTMGVSKSLSDISYFSITEVNTNAQVLKLSASPNGGVALGAGSELVNNAVSVGAEGNERRITHVADGVNPTDAVNVRQLEQLQGQFDPQVAALQSQMADVVSQIEALTTRLDDLQ